MTVPVMNMQHKLYTIQFFSPPNDQLCNQRLQNLRNSQKMTELMAKDQIKIKKNENKKQLPSFLNGAHRPWHGTFPLPSLGRCLAVPPQPLHTCPSAEHGRLEKALDFTAMTENASATNILLVLNPNHGSYWEENELCPSPNQGSSIIEFSVFLPLS